METWTRQPQETAGSYEFNGTFYITKEVSEKLSPQEIACIYGDAKNFANENGGIDYLQVYTDGKGGKLFFIDQLNKEMLESGGYLPEDNHCTLMWAHEY